MFMKLHLYLFVVMGMIFMVGCQPVKNATPVENISTESNNTDITYHEFYLLDSIRIVLNDGISRSKTQNLILYALPNGNSIEKTMGKLKNDVDDWHFHIQYIDAQTRWLRDQTCESYSVAYLEAPKLSWPAWKRSHEDYGARITKVVDTLRSMYPAASLTLNSHSGGGSFINGFIDTRDSIPQWLDRLVFIDSDYGYTTDIGLKLDAWLKQDASNKLVAFAYNDSIALYKGKPFVSATGGTWYRTKMMRRELAINHPMTKTEGADLIKYQSMDDQVLIILKKNPGREIFHTEQVRLNGFIHSMLFGTHEESRGYTYFGEECYDRFIQGTTPEFNSTH